MQFGYNVAVTASSVGLLLQWTQLTANLSEKVLDAGEVGFGCDETPLCLLATLAELEHPCGFFDDQATVFRASVEHRIDLALADDDVLGAADA